MSNAIDSGQAKHANELPKLAESYLDRAKECMEQVLQMTSGSNSTKVKLNPSQCTYLAGELKTAVEDSSKSYGRSSSFEHKAECLETLQLLYQLAKEVKSFIQDCCNDRAWIQAASTWASVPVRVSSLGCYLKLCTRLLRNSNKLGAAWLEFVKIQSLKESELLAVREKAFNDDQETLFSLLSSKSESGNLVQLATILSERLRVKKTSPQPSNQKLWKEEAGRLSRLEILGKGTSSTVYKTKWLGAVDVAEKLFPVPSKEFVVGFENEVSLLVQLSHPSVVTYLGYRADDQSCSAAMELMDGDVKVLMQQKLQEDSAREAPFSIMEACDMMLQVAEGVHYIHEKGIVHRNLKSNSVLFKRSKGPDIDYVSVKVANFGLSKFKDDTIEADFPEVTYLDPGVRAAGPHKYWMAPELVILEEDGREAQIPNKTSLSKCSKKSDSFSFGMFCFEILTGNIPFSDIEKQVAMKRIKLDDVRPELPGRCPQDLKSLIKLCWDAQPDTRPSFDKICEELLYIRCSLLQETLEYDQPDQPLLSVPKALDLPGDVTRDFKGDYSSLEVVSQLGKGGLDTVTVYSATWRRPEGAQENVAQKTFIGRNDECFVNEVSIMAYLNPREHPNVVRLLCYATSRRSCSIVMERMDADLYDLIRQRNSKHNSTAGPFTLDEVVAIMLQIAQGMHYIHQMNIAHRDLKSCNILYREATGRGNAIEDRQLHVKVADFGLSIRMDSSNLSLKASKVGTVRWMAPEVMRADNSSNYDPLKSDVYCFGMVGYEILKGRVPFYDEHDLKKVEERVLFNERPDLPDWTPSDLEALIANCWQREASRRPSFAEIVQKLGKIET